MDEQKGHSPQLTKLRGILADGLARARLNQTQLAQRAGLGRTTVSEAVSPQKPVPSASPPLGGGLSLSGERLVDGAGKDARPALEGMPGGLQGDGPGVLLHSGHDAGDGLVREWLETDPLAIADLRAQDAPVDGGGRKDQGLDDSGAALLVRAAVVALLPVAAHVLVRVLEALDGQASRR
ncbi:hypothetical protein AB0G86_41165 [Streptomyces scabiei]|uniref:hypothetical protein n=1 Tax=Streptomyces scabiei TaxID=1930 RepID=UPI0033D99410